MRQTQSRRQDSPKNLNPKPLNTDDADDDSAGSTDTVELDQEQVFAAFPLFSPSPPAPSLTIALIYVPRKQNTCKTQLNTFICREHMLNPIEHVLLTLQPAHARNNQEEVLARHGNSAASSRASSLSRYSGGSEPDTSGDETSRQSRHTSSKVFHIVKLLLYSNSKL